MSEGAGTASAVPRLVGLTPGRHGTLRLDVAARFQSARGMTAVPVVLPEIAEAAAHYPIMFVGDPVAQIAAIVGIRGAENLFVGPDGSWAEGSYVPAMLRRQPLTLGRTGSETEFAVLIDEAHGALSTTRGQPLFDADQPTKLTQDLMDLCRDMAAASSLTDAFIAAVRDEGLLEPSRVTYTLPGGGPGTVQGFFGVSAEKLGKLPDSIVTDWFRRGYLAGIHYHQASAGRWAALVRRAQAIGEASDGAGTP